MLQKIPELTGLLLLVSLGCHACAKKSTRVAFDPPTPDAQLVPLPIDPSLPGIPLDRPSPGNDQVDSNTNGLRINAVFQSGSQFANESSSVAANELFTMPNRREQAQTWIDQLGKFWIFGGRDGELYRQDLWHFNPSIGIWTEVSNSALQPTARAGALTWQDDEGNLHLAGGENVEHGHRTFFLDHWVFHAKDQKWTEFADKNTDFIRNHAAIFHRAGSPSFFYGGYQGAESGGVIYRDELWTLDTGGKTWRLIPATKSPALVPKPSPRSAAGLWLDSKGFLWLHAGFGADQKGNEGHLNDLWTFDIQNNSWSLVAGTTAVESCRVDIPETQGPLARAGGLYWTDRAGQLWLFGGESLLQCGSVTHLNDLWRFNPEHKTWTLLRKRSADPHSNYAAGNFGIGSRSFSSSWYEASQDKIWIFGGYGYAGDLLSGSLRDVWTFTQEKSR